MKNFKGKFLKTSKGITLVAMVVTIIVLLILAGVAIATLMGDNGVINQTSQSKTKNRRAGAQEEVELAIQALRIDKISKNVGGTLSAYILETKNQAEFKKAIGSDDVTFEEGYITYKNIKFAIDSNGKITGKSEVVPLPANAVQSLAKAGTIKVGDYVNYTPSSGSVTVTAAQTGAESDQTFSTANESGMTWRVLSVNDTTGEVKIVGSPTTTQLTLYGKAGFGNAETVLNNIGAIFGGGTGASSARSITEDDVFDAIGYDKVANYVGWTKTYTSGELFTETWDETKGTAIYSTTTTTATVENPIILHCTASKAYNESYELIGDGINIASQTLENGTPEKKESMQIIWQMLIGENYDNLYSGYNYWCASRLFCFVNGEDENFDIYSVRFVNEGGICSGFGDSYLYNVDGSERGRNRSVLPIITLHSDAQLERVGSTNTWNFVIE